LFGEEHKFLSSFLKKFLHIPDNSYLTGPNTFIRLLYSDIVNQRTSLTQGQVLHSSKTAGIIVALYALNFTTLYSGCEKMIVSRMTAAIS